MRFQATDYYCGPAALQNALLVHRVTVSQDRIAELAGTTEAEGTDEDGLKRAALALGHSLDEYSTGLPQAAWNWVVTSLTAGRPLVLCVDRWGHWLTVAGLCGGRVVVFEPGRYGWSTRENGVLVVPRDRLLRRWRAARRVRGPDGPRYYGLAVGPLGAPWGRDVGPAAAVS